MITVKNNHGKVDKIEKGEAFEVDSTGTLLIKNSEYGKEYSRAYASGCWQDVVVEEKVYVEPKEFVLDLDLIHSKLPVSAAILLDNFEWHRVTQRYKNEIEIRKVGETSTYFYKGREIRWVGERSVEVEIIARSLAPR